MRWLLHLGRGAATLVPLLVGCGASPPTDDPARRAALETMVAEARQEFPQVPGVDVAGLERLRREREVVLVDVREPVEREVSMIPGAIPAERFDAEREQHRDAVVVAYCTIGYRSGLWAEHLREQGFDARNLEGSILGWTHAGRPLVGPDGEPTRRVHVYGERWNLAAEGYEAVW